MLSVFDTTSIRSQQRFRTWRTVMNDIFFPMTCAPGFDESDFNGEIERLPLGSAALYGIRSQGIRYGRGCTEIASHQSNTCQLFMLREGAVRVSQNDRQVALSAGDMFLYDTNMPFFLEMPEKYDSLVLQLPRTIMEARVPGLQELMARPINGHSGVARLLGNMLVDASTMGALPDDMMLARLGVPLTEVVALALESSLGCVATEETRSERQAALLSRLKSRILEQMGDPDIDLQTIAGKMGISPRTMNRLFATDGSTPMHWLWQQRLIDCHRALSEGRSSSVTEVAVSHGFASLSHFSRSFKQAFGVSPKSLIQTVKR